VYLTGRPYVLAVMTKYAMNDEAEQDVFVSEIARTTHRYMTALATSNEYGGTAHVTAVAALVLRSSYTPRLGRVS